MREIAIVISDLYLAADLSGEAPDAARSSRAGAAAWPGLAEVVRFGQKSALEDGWRAWLARSLDRDDLARAAPAAVAGAGLPAGPSARGKILGAFPAGAVWFATPIHLVAGLTSLHLDYRSLLCLPAEDSTRLAEDFAATFGATEFHLEPTPSGVLLLRSQSSLEAVTTDPSRALVHELAASLPAGPDAGVLRRLGAEMEMWLHNHPLNEARAGRGESPVSTLWLWGGGPSLEVKEDPALPMNDPTSGVQPVSSAQPVSGIAFGSDPYLAGLCRLSGMPLRPLTGRLTDLSEYSDLERVAFVVDMTSLLHANPHWRMLEALASIDSDFIQPALAALNRGAVDNLVVVANDMELHIRRRDRLKLWRRRPRSGDAVLRALRS